MLPVNIRTTAELPDSIVVIELFDEGEPCEIAPNHILSWDEYMARRGRTNI